MKVALYKTIKEITEESTATIWLLFKILIPALILVKILDHFGGTELIANLTAPLMEPLGLPDMAGIIWATAMLINIYASVAVFLSLASPAEWTQAQVTCLAILMLTTHNLIVELRIAQQAGCRLLTQLLLRVFCAVLFCYALHVLFTTTGTLQQNPTFVWQPEVIDSSLYGWVVEQIKNLGKIAVLIFLLITCLKLLKAIGIEKLIVTLLQPLFRFMGIGTDATSMTVVGFTLGLAYGGGLLIREAQSGRIDKRNIFAAVSLLGICHSLIEDTFLVLIIGADFYTVLFIRLLFSVIVIAILMKSIQKLSPRKIEKYLVKPTTSN